MFFEVFDDHWRNYNAAELFFFRDSVAFDDGTREARVASARERVSFLK